MANEIIVLSFCIYLFFVRFDIHAILSFFFFFVDFAVLVHFMLRCYRKVTVSSLVIREEH